MTRYALDDFWKFATHKDNLALGDPENLARGGLGKISLTGCAYIGGSDPDQYITKGMGYSGTCAGVQLFSGMMRPEDAVCLYQASAQHAGLCPAFSSLFTGAGSGNTGSATASGLAGEADGLAYAQRPNMMRTEDILDQSSARAMDGPSEILRGVTPNLAVAACVTICTNAGEGYPFVGLQSHDQCNCGHVYNKRDGMPQLDDSECDMNGDGRPDCGMGFDLTTTNPRACVWRNAVYDISGTIMQNSSPASPVFVGCFADSEGEPHEPPPHYLHRSHMQHTRLRRCEFEYIILQSFADSEGNFGDDITLGGDVYVDTGYGLTFDGAGDYAIIASPAAGNYADEGEFTIGFFFTRSDCFVPGTWETLFAHRGIDQRSDLYLSSRRTANTDLRNTAEIYLGCGGENSVISDLDGTIIRILLADQDGTRVTFDISAEVEQSGVCNYVSCRVVLLCASASLISGENAAWLGGYITASWAHITLSVTHTGVNVYIDGQPIPANFTGFSPLSFENDWAKSDANSAFANGPATLTSKLNIALKLLCCF